MNKLIFYISSYLKSLKNFLTYLANRERTIFYVGGFPSIPNLGDVALFNSYEAFFPDHKLIYFRGNAIERFLYAGNNSPAVLGGGTLINRLCLHEAHIGSLTFKNFWVLGTGVAQDSYWKEKRGDSQLPLWKAPLLQAKYRGVRGPLSRSQLSSYDIDSEVFYDPVLYLQNQNSLQNSPDGKVIGLNIGQSSGNIWGGEQALKERFVKIANLLKSQGHTIYWFVVCPEDLPITNEVAKQSNTDEHIYCEFYDYKVFYQQSQSLSYFIGIKLHAVVLALCNSIPSLMVEYRPKCLDFMSSLGLEEYSVRADKLDEQNILQYLTKLNDLSRDDIYKRIEKARLFQKQKIAELKI